MKLSNLSVAAIALAIAGLPASAQENTDTAAEAINETARPDAFADGLKTLPGTYAGDYFCTGSGLHGLTLEIGPLGEMDKDANVMDTGAGAYPVIATLWFYPLMSNPAAPKGAFMMTGTLDAFGQLKMVPGDWIEQPSNYGAAEIDAAYDADEGVIRGKPSGRGAAATGCIAMNLSKLAVVQ